MKRGGYYRLWFHVPSRIASDSQFPFKPGQELRIEVDPRKKVVVLSAPA